jgi:hypothetical protein
VVQARLENVSLSGAFVRTPVCIPVWSQVEVELDLPRMRRSDRFRVPAYVVRATEEGVGLEWSDFAPRAVRALLAIARTRVALHRDPRRDRISIDPSPGLPAAAVAALTEHRHAQAQISLLPRSAA